MKLVYYPMCGPKCNTQMQGVGILSMVKKRPRNPKRGSDCHGGLSVAGRTHPCPSPAIRHICPWPYTMLLPESHSPPPIGYASRKAQETLPSAGGGWSPPAPLLHGLSLQDPPYPKVIFALQAASGVRTAGPTVGTVGLATPECFNDLILQSVNPSDPRAFRTLNSVTKPI